MVKKSGIYRVYINEKAEAPLETARFVKEGFCIWALIFGPLWSLYSRLWLLSFIFISISVALTVAGNLGYVGQIQLQAVTIGINLLFAFEGRDWIADKLAYKGYKLFDIVTGDSEQEAQIRFFDNYHYTNQSVSSPEFSLENCKGT